MYLGKKSIAPKTRIEGLIDPIFRDQDDKARQISIRAAQSEPASAHARAACELMACLENVIAGS